MRTLVLLLPLALLGCRNDPEDADEDGFNEFEDCNDADAAVFPGAAETCDGIDEDCDGVLDEGAPDAWANVGTGGSDLFIYAYEASRPDATDEEQGTATHRSCSALAM